MSTGRIPPAGATSVKTRRIIFKTSDIWTPPAGVYCIDLFMLSGGNGGDAGYGWKAGNGGSGGQSVFIRDFPVKPGISYPVTVGAGGAGGAYTGTGSNTVSGLSGGFSAFGNGSLIRSPQGTAAANSTIQNIYYFLTSNGSVGSGSNGGSASLPPVGGNGQASATWQIDDDLFDFLAGENGTAGTGGDTTTGSSNAAGLGGHAYTPGAGFAGGGGGGGSSSSSSGNYYPSAGGNGGPGGGGGGGGGNGASPSNGGDASDNSGSGGGGSGGTGGGTGYSYSGGNGGSGLVAVYY